MNIIRLLAGAVLLVLAGCAAPRGAAAWTAPAGGSEQIESAQVQVGHGQVGTPDYGEVLSDPGPF